MSASLQVGVFRSLIDAVAPACNMAILTLHDNEVHLLSADVKQPISASANMEMDVQRDGVCRIHVATMRSVLRLAPLRKPIQLDIDDNGTTVSWGRQKHHMPHLNLPRTTPQKWPVDVTSTFHIDDAVECLRFCRDAGGAKIILRTNTDGLQLCNPGDLCFSVLQLPVYQNDNGPFMPRATFTRQIKTACNTKDILTAFKGGCFARQAVLAIDGTDIYIHFYNKTGSVTLRFPRKDD